MKKELIMSGHGSLYHIADLRKTHCIGDQVKTKTMARKLIITDIIVKHFAIEYLIDLTANCNK